MHGMQYLLSQLPFFTMNSVELSIHSHRPIVTNSTMVLSLPDRVARGMHVWEQHAHIGCDSVLRERAHIVPKLANAMPRWSETGEPHTDFESLSGWIEAMPTGIEGRLQMLRVDLTGGKTRHLSIFLLRLGETSARGWSPNNTDCGRRDHGIRNADDRPYFIVTFAFLATQAVDRLLAR